MSDGARVGEQLRLPLAWEPAVAVNSLPTSVDTVLAAWSADSVVGASTAARFAQILGRFTGFAAARGVTTLAGVDHELLAEFVAARHRNQDGTITAPTVTTRRARRTALRAFFATAVRLRLTLDDPSAQLHHEQSRSRTATGVRPLTDDEAVLVRLYSQRATPTRHAVTVALLLAGLHTCEAAAVSIADIDMHAGTVSVHGSRRYQSRTLRLHAWSRRVLTERIDHLRHHNPADGGSLLLCGNPGGSAASRQACVCVTVHEVLTRAGLSGQPGLRASSLTGHPARTVFDRTRRIEKAAELLGTTSLDTAAALIGHHWRAQPPS